MSKIIGITGGIGSGKSTVCEGLQAMGCSVFYCDSEAKYLMQNDSTVRAAIIDLFGNMAYTDEGLNRKWISEQVFQYRALLNRLNGIVHPAVKTRLIYWAAQQTAPLCFVESAILFESGLSEVCDMVVGVVADEHIRLERAMKRDYQTKEQIMSRISKQLPQQDIVRKADFTITNNGDESIDDLCLRVWKFCRNFAGHKNK